MQLESDESAGGLGLGLALVAELVHLHGGRVSADSDGPGAEFTVSLRLYRRADEIERNAGRPARFQLVGRTRIHGTVGGTAMPPC